MTPSEWAQFIVLIVVIVLSLTLSIVALIKARKEGVTRKVIAIFVSALGLLFIAYLSYYLGKIEPADWAQIMLMLGLVAVTGLYAFSSVRQADASVKMAQEMREQRRPIVVPEVVPFEVETPKIHKIDYTRDDIFKVRNVGNGPAIELQIVQLDKEKGRPQIQKKAILSQADTPLEFYPVDLANQEKTTCYLVCQYRSVLSPNVRQIWYETWLPFEPVKSQSGDKIIIKPGELEFREVFEKKSY